MEYRVAVFCFELYDESQRVEFNREKAII